jgi:ATP-dependent DNA ligase
MPLIRGDDGSAPLPRRARRSAEVSVYSPAAFDGTGQVPGVVLLVVRSPPPTPHSGPRAFDHDDFIFELKMDGFRALAHVGPDETCLVSRQGNVYKGCAAIHIDLDCEAVLDGEIVTLR